VVAVDLAVLWEPNAPDAVLVVNDYGRACLAVAAHYDDQDQTAVVLVWDGCLVAEMGPPNDEARHTHPLFDEGLRDVLWLGEVLDSLRIATIANMVSKVPARHFVVPLKEGLVEAVADSVTVRRWPGSTAEAAFAALIA
jgi:hypothetical protein